MMCVEPFQKRTWANIDLNAIIHNFKQVKRCVSRAMVCCVVKANAYGHGAVELGRLYERLGADFLAVSNIEEAMQLRKSGITLPILILGYTDPRCVSLLAENNISQCVYAKEYGEALSKNASKENLKVKIHIKLDTGMGRIGFLCKNDAELDIDSIYDVCQKKALVPEGIFTHFASADEGNAGEEYTMRQFHCFEKTVQLLQERGIAFPIKHCANSAAIFDYPQMHLDMVRAGIVLYGLQPSGALRNKVELKQALTLHTIINHIKELAPAECVSYGRDFTADSVRRIATIPIGYADGLWRSNAQNPLIVQIGDEFAPVVGRICMDQCMIDITDLKSVQFGDDVIVYGLNEQNSIDRIAKQNHTINYEIICSLGERVPRVYTSDQKIVRVVDNLWDNQKDVFEKRDA